MNKFLVVVFSIFSFTTYSQILDNIVKWEFSQKQISETEVELQFKAEIEENWHLYSQDIPETPPATTFTFIINGDTSIKKIKEPNAIEEYDSNFEMALKYFVDEAIFKHTIDLSEVDNIKIDGYVDFMVCDDKQCLPPDYEEFNFTLKLTESYETDVLGCVDSSQSNYNPNATVDDGSCIYPIVVSVTGNNLSCNGANDGSCSVAVSGGQTPYTYLWNTGQTTSSINNLSAGTYTVTVTDDSGQTQTTSYTITEPSAITIIYSVTNVSFAGGNDGAINITPSGGVTPYLYYWNTNPTQTTQSINNLIAGTYTVWVVDANGCIGTVSITINENISTTCGAITGVNLTDVIHDRATFNWDNMNISSCQVDQIRIRYREVGTNSYSTKTMGVPTGSGCNTSNTSKLVLGLSPSTTYEYDFKIWYCNASAVNWHAGGTFTTLPLCDNVINVVPTPITTTKTQFCWDSVSTYAFVRLQYRENVPGSSFSNIGGMGVFSPILCKEKNGLTPGLSYRVMWRTWCNPSGGPYRSPVWDGPVIWTQSTSVRISDSNEGSLLKVVDILGREVNPNKVIDNITLFYIYSDGSVARRIFFK